METVWDVSKAYRQTTPTRERICINGLWRWQPADDETDEVPEGLLGIGVPYDFWTLNEQVSEINQRPILAGQ